MLMIQGKKEIEQDRVIKQKDQIALYQNDEAVHIGCVDMVIDEIDSGKSTIIFHTKDSLIHIVRSEKWSDNRLEASMRYDEISVTIYSESGIKVCRQNEFQAMRQKTANEAYPILVHQEDEYFITREKVKVKEERPLTIEDELKYVNDGCTYDILYISPAGNMIIKNQKTGEERVVNKKDRQLQIALGIRNA